MQINSNQFPEMYESLGIKLDNLGCVMLKTPLGAVFSGSFDHYKDFAYKSQNEARFWIDGFVGMKNPHLTLLYGLLDKAEKNKEWVNKVLEGWNISQIKIKDIGFFESPYEDDPYYCIVAHVKLTPEIENGRQRLELLPHINTFVGYKPHITLAYIKKDDVARDQLIEFFRTRLHSAEFAVNPSDLILS